jgi:hypothetical protein
MPERPNPRELIGGHATSTLSREERELLFAAAFEDQQLFDELVNEEPLRELLDDPVTRQRLVDELSEQRAVSGRWFHFAGLRWSPLHPRYLVVTGSAVVILLAVVVALVLRRPGPPVSQPTTGAGQQEKAQVNPPPGLGQPSEATQVQPDAEKPTDVPIDQGSERARQLDRLRKQAREKAEEEARQYAESGGSRRATGVAAVRDADAGGGAVTTPGAQSKTVTGMVKSATADSLVLTADNKDMAFAVTPKTKLSARGVGATRAIAADAGRRTVNNLVRVGDTIAVTYQQADATMLATEVRITINNRNADASAISILLQVYAQAYSNLDASMVQVLFPSADARMIQEQMTAYSAMRVSQVQIRDEQFLNFTGATATVSCSWEVTSAGQDGTSQVAVSKVVLRLQKSCGLWIIVDRQ